MLGFVGLLLLAGVVSIARIPSRPESLSALVDHFVGVEAGGNTVPGPQLPFGFVNLSPDTPRIETSGYNSFGKIIGFSQTHVSGTGGGSKYGNFLTTPATGEVRPDDICVGQGGRGCFSRMLYGGVLTRYGIKAEFTATRLVGMHGVQPIRDFDALVCRVYPDILAWTRSSS